MEASNQSRKKEFDPFQQDAGGNLKKAEVEMQRESLQVKSGFEFDHYFPKAKLITITKKKGATVADTLQLIPAVIRETLFHTKRFANEVIKADTLEKTCRNLWQFVYDHIAYKKDEDGKEQVRSPARAWHDRHNVDADRNQTLKSNIN
jgi:hypothetical protein